ncbi:hypothetical protein GLYMA_09G124450v4 [Glycine max]|nr:hypothetical protein GLYMA_09G124450v4 [Glycine max]KAH1042717.1 hypothetical protein GYH30_024837 [Glycine max]
MIKLGWPYYQVCGELQVSKRWFITKVPKIYWKHGG